MFPSEETIVKVQCPTLIVHGAVDRVSEGMGWGGGAGMREGGSDGHVLDEESLSSICLPYLPSHVFE